MTLRHRVHRVLYVPLDDRPVNLSLPALLAGIVDYEMTTPPRELLGSYHTPGQPEAIVDWLLHQPVQQPDCLVLSLDMLLYGGLVASRMPAVSPEMARESLEALARLRQTFPEAQIYAFSILTRLDFGLSEEDAQRYGDNLHRYVRLAGDRTRREEAGEIARNLPKGLLETYTRVRQRNHELSLAALDQVAAGNLDFLVLGQDDADCQGFHLSEQKALKARLRKHKLTQRATLYAGADEIGALLFARFVHQHMEETPKVAVLYLEPPEAEVAPYEDRPFIENLRLQAAAAGVELVDDQNEADMILAVSPPAGNLSTALINSRQYAKRCQRLEKFAQQIAELAERRGVAICDAAFPNGAEEAFMTALQAAGLPWPRLLSFAAWNTAGNSLGTALAHGTVRLIGLRDKAAFDLAQLVTSISPMRYFELLNSLIGAEKAHLQLLLTRLADDWLYQTCVRTAVRERMADLMTNSGFELTAAYGRAEGMVREMLVEAISNLWVEEFMGGRAGDIGPPEHRSGLTLAELQDTQVRLPWRRLFEVELDFDLGLELTATS